MIKFLKAFLSSILMISFTVGGTKIFENITTKVTEKDSPFHSDITFSNSGTWTSKEKGDKKNQEQNIYTNEININWRNNANSWEQFQNYYKKITIYATGYAKGKKASEKKITDVNISTSDIETQDNWHDNATLKSESKYSLASTTYSSFWGSYEKAGVYYDVILSGNLIKLRFYLWASINQYGLGSRLAESHIDYKGGVISSSWSFDNIYNNLERSLSNQINLTSNYSGSLEDKNNITDPTGKGNDETTLINSIIANILQEDYGIWQQYIQPIAFSDKTKKATIIFKFTDPVDKKQKVWTFFTPINIILSHDYWGKSLRERLKINPGKVVNPQDSRKGMVDDQPIQLEPNNVNDTYGGNLQYHTTAHIEFDGTEDSNEWMTINGEPIEVLNNKFIYHMVDNRTTNTDKTNVYDIVLHHKTNNAPEEQYEIKYTINSLVPTLTEKWYAWNPEKNSNQKDLITPTLANGKANPKYDQEVNPKTGTKTEIIWVNKKSEYPFPLDPLNQNSEVINPNQNPNDYDLGFIAEGSVVGMGVQQLFNPSEVANVSREGVDKSLNQYSSPNSQQQLKVINPDTDNKYWSWEGMWHYIIRTSDQLASEKYVLIGDNYQDKYSRFLDVLNDSTIAVDFWTTIHGLHLKNYLAQEKQLDSATIATLNYEQVATYWKEYTSDIIAQRIPPNPEPADYLDLSKIAFYTIKMNLTTIELIKQEIINQVTKQLAKINLSYQADYQFQSFDDESISKLLNYDNNGNATINLTIKALATSTKVIGTNTITIINNINYDPKTVVDLSNVKFVTQQFNFSNFTIEQLKTWIFQDITQTFEFYQISLDYPNDYGITPLDELTLEQFLTNEMITNLTITIYAQDASLNAINATTLKLINDPDTIIAPTEPPGQTPILPGKSSWSAKKRNLIILSVVVVFSVGGVGTVIFIKYHFKKGIGGKKKLKITKKD